MVEIRMIVQRDEIISSRIRSACGRHWATGVYIREGRVHGIVRGLALNIESAFEVPLEDDRTFRVRHMVFHLPRRRA